MEISKHDVYAYQIVQYLVTCYHYQVIRIKQYKDDIWLANPDAVEYPVIRVTNNDRNSLADETYIRNAHRMILNLIHREGSILTLNTNPHSLTLHQAIYKQVRIVPNEVSDRAILKVFKELDHVVHEVTDLQSEFVELTKSIEEAQLRMQKAAIEKTRKQIYPKATICLIAICTLLSLFCYAASFLFDDMAAGWVVMGVYYKMNIVAAHEYWRLLSSGFLYVELPLMVYHMYVLFQVGKLCEPTYQKGKFVSIFIISIIVGNIFMLISDGNVIGYGAGAGVFGITGAYIAAVVGNKTYRYSNVRISILKFLILALLICLLPGISIFAHFGGLLCGFLLGIIFLTKDVWKHVRPHARNASVAFLIVLGFLGFKSNTINVFNKELDSKIVSIYENTPLNDYARYLRSCYNKVYEMEL